MRCLGNTNEAKWPGDAEFWFRNIHMTCVWRREEPLEKGEKHLEEDIGLSSPICAVLSWKQTSSVLLETCKMNALNYLVAIYWIFSLCPYKLLLYFQCTKCLFLLSQLIFIMLQGQYWCVCLRTNYVTSQSLKRIIFLNMKSLWFNINNWAVQLDQPKLISQLCYPLVLLPWATEFKLS